ncbi:hypothetical protein SPSIL_058230 [Sporomusa silvacetica DSM 10669]|uniref:Uncharacterized protein n=1 Tax=Sporomusa silvacetica DSM 10669 TaxID=1123289 RepID=A0ABZ3IV63_9FIRM|nr:hypothetical protein SPSIL_49560 [Sporomusa silvacetica DSM 10669]
MVISDGMRDSMFDIAGLTYKGRYVGSMGSMLQLI